MMYVFGIFVGGDRLIGRAMDKATANILVGQAKRDGAFGVSLHGAGVSGEVSFEDAERVIWESQL